MAKLDPTSLLMGRRQMARSAVQSGYMFLWLTCAAFVLFASIPQLILWFIGPEAAFVRYTIGLIATIWLFVRIIIPSVILLQKHYWRVHDLAVAADPSLAKAIVWDQWSYLRRDLTLPWRALRG